MTELSSLAAQLAALTGTPLVDPTDEAPVPSTDGRVLRAIRASLEAQRERMLERPIIARVPQPAPRRARPSAAPAGAGVGGLFGLLADQLGQAAPAAVERNPWRESADGGTVEVRIEIDYDDRWRGFERDVLDDVKSTVEESITFLTEFQRALLERSPREFLAMLPRPETAELVSYETAFVGGAERVVALTLAEGPQNPGEVTHVAIVPNLVPIERQLAALRVLEDGQDEGVLDPLRALVGLVPPEDVATRPLDRPEPPARARLDAFQQTCVDHAARTPHFALVQGPPGSGKTTVISTILKEALARGERVLVVSPTHVAVDNVVEKLVPTEDGPDALSRPSLPVRYASRKTPLLPVALDYWVGPKKQKRAATIARRVEARLTDQLPVAGRLFSRVDPDLGGYAPLTRAIADQQRVFAGTPIGILSCEAVKLAPPGGFDLLIVDEVSKMTVPEFLAVAVKARRWLLVGDPEQLPPYNDAAENGVSLDDVLTAPLELFCSVGALLERVPPHRRADVRLVVAAREPALVAEAIRAHLGAVGLRGGPPIRCDLPPGRPGVLVCAPEDAMAGARAMQAGPVRDHSHTERRVGSVELLVERGLPMPRPDVASGVRLVEVRRRAPAAIFDKAFAAFHAQPWAERAHQKLPVVSFRKGLAKALPTPQALAALGMDVDARDLVGAIAVRFAVNAVSVFDWLAGAPVDRFDVAPLVQLTDVFADLAPLRRAVAPFTGVLRKQYRMHPSLSRVPRALFYFGEALQDGRAGLPAGNRLQLVQVDHHGGRAEDNPAEADEIRGWLERIAALRTQGKTDVGAALVITPYRAQERLLRRTLGDAEREGLLADLTVEVCTLDRCQGREADLVFISLVRNRATPFLDQPKRWNVALTRARDGLLLVGDLDAFHREARKARREAGPGGAPRMSLLARILESCARAARGRS